MSQAVGAPSPRRLLALAKNALEFARLGGFETDEQPAPHEIATRGVNHRLRHYFAGDAGDRPPILLVAPLMMSAELWDVSTATSAVRRLHDAGIDPWVVDFGRPDEEPGGLERTLSDHVVAVSDAIDVIRAERGRDVHLAGYSQGGMLCYQVAAYRRSRGLASVMSFGSPVDLRQMIPAGLPPGLIAAAGNLLGALGERVAVPGWATKNAFKLLDPVKATRRQLEFVLRLHDRDALLPQEGQRRFIERDGWIAFPGPALVDFAQQFMAQNRMLMGGIVIGGRTLTLADVSCPLLAFIGELDEVASAAAIRPLARAAPASDVWEAWVKAGHLGLVVGSRASAEAWPAVVEWIRWLDEDGPEPVRAQRMDAGPGRAPVRAPDPLPTRVGTVAGLVAGVSADAARVAATTATRSVRNARSLAADASQQLPLLASLQQVRPDTRTSMALLLDEQARADPARSQFLFEDRVHTREAAKARFDAVVRGLLSVGVRRGERVAVLMEARPSSVSTMVALNRIGAVAVLLRADGDPSAEAQLGAAGRVVCSPDLIPGATATGLPVYVLGGGGEERTLDGDVVDLERIDPATVTPPRWYDPNPGRARDLAFVLFTGSGTTLRVNRITNQRWMLSAVGTASAASLGTADTVYCTTPVAHPSGLLVGMAGAVAGGSRFAMASGTSSGAFDAGTFWDEVRRYGATVVTYRWSMLRELVDAPHHPGEEHHPVRLFVGSGMPVALWRRVLRRFSPARVVEFYTAPDAEAVLVNLGSGKIGSLGRPLPGSARVRIVRWDTTTDALELDAHGAAVPCAVGETGMLLAEANAELVGSGAVDAVRGVFAAGDAWVLTGDLARRDADGDLWFVDVASSIVHGDDGPRSPRAIRDALEAIPAVDRAVVYRATVDDGDVAVAAVELVAGERLTAEDLEDAFSGERSPRPPAAVRVVGALPIASGDRPDAGALRSDGLGKATQRRPVFTPAGDGSFVRRTS